MATAYVLLADITGSTALYQRLPQRTALDEITLVLTRMREMIEDNGGHCVKSQGDDSLSYFASADQLFAAARAMIEADWPQNLAVHAGACWGSVLSQDHDIYGDPVNTAARLAALAKPGEVLLANSVRDRLDPDASQLFVPIGALKLKGRNTAVEVFSFTASDMATQTVIFGTTPQAAPRMSAAILRCNGQDWSLQDGDSLSVGRAPDSHAVLAHPWVSRQHGRFELRGAQLEYTDHSSGGSTVITADGQEFALQRRSMLLSGAGVVLIGTGDASLSSSQISYRTESLV